MGTSPNYYVTYIMGHNNYDYCHTRDIAHGIFPILLFQVAKMIKWVGYKVFHSKKLSTKKLRLDLGIKFRQLLFLFSHLDKY